MPHHWWYPTEIHEKRSKMGIWRYFLPHLSRYPVLRCRRYHARILVTHIISQDLMEALPLPIKTSHASASTFDLRPGEAPSCITRSCSFAEEMPSFHPSPGEDAAKTSADRWAWDLQKIHGESESMVILWDLMVILLCFQHLSRFQLLSRPFAGSTHGFVSSCFDYLLCSSNT